MCCKCFSKEHQNNTKTRSWHVFGFMVSCSFSKCFHGFSKVLHRFSSQNTKDRNVFATSLGGAWPPRGFQQITNFLWISYGFSLPCRGSPTTRGHTCESRELGLGFSVIGQLEVRNEGWVGLVWVYLFGFGLFVLDGLFFCLVFDSFGLGLFGFGIICLIGLVAGLVGFVSIKWSYQRNHRWTGFVFFFPMLFLGHSRSHFLWIWLVACLRLDDLLNAS